MNFLKQRLLTIGSRTIISYLMILSIAILLKYHYHIATTNDLDWILKPTAELVSMILNKPFINESLTGYTNWEYHIIIAKSCAGINFLITAFCMVTVTPAIGSGTLKRNFRFILNRLFVVYLLTILVNTLRIIISIFQLNADIYSNWITREGLHRFTGIIIFFTALSLLHLISSKASSPKRSGHSMIRPFIWYLLILILIPLFRSFLNGPRKELTGHAIVLILTATAITLLFSIPRYLLHRQRKTLTIKKIH